MSKPAKPTAKYILFGADEYAKPRAARFSAENPALLTKAAETMFLRLVQVTDPEVAEVAATLPAGRLHANGKGLVPYIKATRAVARIIKPGRELVHTLSKQPASG